MSEIDLVRVGDDVAVIGDSKAVDLFVASTHVESSPLDMPRLSKVIAASGAGTQAAAQIAEQSGRWIKLTAQSAKELKTDQLMTGKDGIQRAVLMKDGRIKNLLQIDPSWGRRANPAILSGAAGMMTQLAMQQAMNEVTDYLARIDTKLDDVLRAQKDAVVSMMVGVGFDIEEAMTLRDHVGRVNEVAWSKVQAASSTVARTQSYALLQLEALAERLEDKARISVLLDAARGVQDGTNEWLAVLARCFQLQDAIAILELDRVMDTAPQDLDGHRLGLKAARDQRLASIAEVTGRLLERMAAAAQAANLKVLLNPSQSPAIVQANSHVTEVMADFHELLGIDDERTSLEARRWAAAVSDVRHRAQAMGSEGLGAAKRATTGARERARSLKGRASGLGDRIRQREGDVDTD